MSEVLDLGVCSMSTVSLIGSRHKGLSADLFGGGRMPSVVWTSPPESRRDPDEAVRLISPVNGVDGPTVDAADGNGDDWLATSCCHLRTRSFARRARLRSTVLRRISLTYLPIRVCCSRQSLIINNSIKYSLLDEKSPLKGHGQGRSFVIVGRCPAYSGPQR